ncbi:MAG: ABC transporter permease [Casimicrobiaceae bacterium]
MSAVDASLPAARPSGNEGRLSVGTSWLLMTPLLALFAFIFVVPVIGMLQQSAFDPDFTTRHFEQAVSRPLYVRIILRTLRISAIVAVGTLLLGYPVAYLMARAKGWQAALMGACVLIPLWTSVLVRSYAWTVLLARNGLVNNGLAGLGLTDAPLRLLYTEGAVIVAMIHVLLPFMVLPLYAVLRTIPADLTQAALGLGASGFQVLRRITLPLSMPGVTSGLVMVFILAIGFYVTPALVGGSQNMMVAQLIASEIAEAPTWGFGAALSTILLLTTLGLMAIFHRAISFERLAGDQS